MQTFDYYKSLIVRNEIDNCIQAVADKIGANQIEMVVAVNMVLCDHQKLALTENAYAMLGCADGSNRANEEEQECHI
ncbi:MAG: hypothetical protein Q4F79_13470 [Eubacteriales bacterium]|nr:hypothetical protein [Eubacteriales bacterium]